MVLLQFNWRRGHRAEGKKIRRWVVKGIAQRAKGIEQKEEDRGYKGREIEGKRERR